MTSTMNLKYNIIISTVNFKDTIISKINLQYSIISTINFKDTNLLSTMNLKDSKIPSMNDKERILINLDQIDLYTF